MKVVSRLAVVAAMVMSILVAPSALATDPCHDEFDFHYDEKAAAASFRIDLGSECGEPDAIGTVAVEMSITRDSLVESGVASTAKVCTPPGICSLEMRFDHDPVEVADYRVDISFRSSGSRLVLGDIAIRSSCQSWVVGASCFPL